MKRILCLFPIVGCTLLSVAHDTHGADYKPTWESLDKHQTPEWFMDAKLGIFMYAPHPTADYWKRFYTSQGQPDFRYSEESFGYRSVEKLTWEPDRIARFIEEIGARYIVWSGDSGSRFLLHPSDYADIPGSSFTYLTGPGENQVDYTGEMARAIRARGLKFGIYRNYLHPGHDPYFLQTMFEMIDRYQPSTLWLDEKKFAYPTEILKGRELLAYYYNHSRDSDNVACEDALGDYKRPTIGKKLVHGDWYRKEQSSPATDFSDGFYARYERFRPYKAYRRHPLNNPSESSVGNFIHWLAHTASHGGNLEIAMDSASDEVFAWFRKELLPLGAWMRQNGEAIYDTRPWVAGVPQMSSASGIPIRFTTKNKVLYAVLLDKPPARVVLPKLQAPVGVEITLLGNGGPLGWKNTARGLVIDNPPSRLTGAFAYAYRISPAPELIK